MNLLLKEFDASMNSFMIPAQQVSSLWGTQHYGPLQGIAGLQTGVVLSTGTSLVSGMLSASSGLMSPQTFVEGGPLQQFWEDLPPEFLYSQQSIQSPSFENPPAPTSSPETSTDSCFLLVDISPTEGTNPSDG